MNRALIAQYFADREHGLQHLTTLFEALVSQRDRAEFSANALLDHIKTLEAQHAAAQRRQNLPLPAREPSDRELATGLKRGREAQAITDSLSALE